MKRDNAWTVHDKFGLLVFSGFQGEDTDVIFIKNCPIHLIEINRLRKKFHEKTPEKC
jgi:hypothetical protein